MNNANDSARLFLAIPVPSKPEAVLAKGVQEYAPYLERKIPPANWHITVAWLGNVQNYTQYIGKICEAIPQPFLPVATVTHMGKGIKPHLLWAYVSKTNILNNVRGTLVARLKEMDFPLPKDIDREFVPHITLAHFTEEAIHMPTADHPVPTSWSVKEAVLYQSIFAETGIQYKHLHSIPFTK